MSFAIFLVGLSLLVGGVAWGLSVVGVAPVYIAISCLVVLGIGIMMAVSRTRTKDISS
jgi:membrane-bound acyltransferase YfiQ involved in biofilm formation